MRTLTLRGREDENPEVFFHLSERIDLLQKVVNLAVRPCDFSGKGTWGCDLYGSGGS